MTTYIPYSSWAPTLSTYIVYKDAQGIKARWSGDGQVKYFDPANGQAVIQWALDAVGNGTVVVVPGNYGAVVLVLNDGNRLVVDRGATMIAWPAILPGATCIVEDWENGRFAYYSLGSIKVYIDYTNGAFSAALYQARYQVPGSIVFSAWRTTDLHGRFNIYDDGYMNWGAGNVVPDTNLYRSEVDTLMTDDDFVVGGNFTVHNDASVEGWLSVDEHVNIGTFLDVGGQARAATMSAVDHRGHYQSTDGTDGLTTNVNIVVSGVTVKTLRFKDGIYWG